MAKSAPGRKKASGALPELRADMRIVVLLGEDDLLKRQAMRQLSDAITAEHGEPMVSEFDGGTVELADVLDEVRTFSLMGGYKLVIVETAQEFVKRYRDEMGRYAASPVDHATLVLRATQWNKGNLDKAIAKVGAMVDCSLASPAAAKAWLMDRAANFHQATLSPQAAELMVDRLGAHATRLDAELGKLAVMTEQGKAIEPALVEQVVGRTSEEKGYVVQDAMLRALAAGPPHGAAQALAKVRELLDVAGQSEIVLLYAAMDLLGKLYGAKHLRLQGQNEYALRRMYWGRETALFMQVVGRYDVGTLRHLFDRVVEVDVRSKSGFGDGVRNVEKLCVLMGG